MVAKKKSWLEVGRVKNSDWFRRLPSPEQEAVLAVLEEQTHESALRLRAALAIVYSSAVYGFTGFFWGNTFTFHPFNLGLTGAIIGAFLGVLAANVITQQTTAVNANAMQSATGLVIGLPGFVLACAGLLAWLVKLFFYS